MIFRCFHLTRRFVQDKFFMEITSNVFPNNLTDLSVGNLLHNDYFGIFVGKFEIPTEFGRKEVTEFPYRRLLLGFQSPQQIFVPREV